jgi:uncharacterized protein
MKKLILMAAFVACTGFVFAQSVDLRRKIEVSGTAEQEVTPDIINVSISLQEYIDGKNKVTIDQLENQLEAAVKDAGVTNDDFTINNLSAYNNTYQKKKNPDFLASKQYLIKLHDLNKYNQIISKVDPKGIQSTGIDSYDYSKIDELKNELKLKALLTAKQKATFLLNGINEKLGDAISIIEVDNGNGMPAQRVMFRAAAMSTTNLPQDSDIDFKKIKLHFQVNAIFEIIK